MRILLNNFGWKTKMIVPVGAFVGGGYLGYKGTDKLMNDAARDEEVPVRSSIRGTADLEDQEMFDTPGIEQESFGGISGIVDLIKGIYNKRVRYLTNKNLEEIADFCKKYKVKLDRDPAREVVEIAENRAKAEAMIAGLASIGLIGGTGLAVRNAINKSNLIAKAAENDQQVNINSIGFSNKAGKSEGTRNLKNFGIWKNHWGKILIGTGLAATGAAAGGAAAVAKSAVDNSKAYKGTTYY